jgi:hypothetical protein
VVEATAPAPRQEQARMLTAEPGETAAVRGVPMPSRPLIVLWAGLVAAFVFFLVFGTLRVGAGNWIGRRMSIRTIWSRFIEYLGDQGATPAHVLVLVAALVVAIVGAVCLLWLAFALMNAPPDTQVEDVSGT